MKETEKMLEIIHENCKRKQERELIKAKKQEKKENGELVLTNHDYMCGCPSFKAVGASFDVQGTSSQGYPRRNFKGKFKDIKFAQLANPDILTCAHSGRYTSVRAEQRAKA